MGKNYLITCIFERTQRKEHYKGVNAHAGRDMAVAAATVQEILKEGHELEVIEPTALRKKIHDELAKAIKRYK